MSQPVAPQKKFKDMTVGEQGVFCVKLCIFFATFGFAFPALLTA